jgi:hypothetical protein
MVVWTGLPLAHVYMRSPVANAACPMCTGCLGRRCVHPGCGCPEGDASLRAGSADTVRQTESIAGAAGTQGEWRSKVGGGSLAVVMHLNKLVAESGRAPLSTKPWHHGWVLRTSLEVHGGAASATPVLGAAIR